MDTKNSVLTYEQLISLFRETDRRLEKQAAELAKATAELTATFKKEATERAKEAAGLTATLRNEAMERAKEAAELEATLKKEAAERAKEAEKRDKEAAELEATLKKEAMERAKEAAELTATLKKEAAERDKEANERLKKLEAMVGGVGNNNGYYAEEFFQNSFSENLEFAGIKFDQMMSNFGVKGKENCDFDIVLVNGDTIAIIETKYRIHPDFVEELVNKKLKQFRRFFPMYQNHSAYLGIAGMSFDKSVIENAKKHGVAVIRQEGKHVVVDSMPTKVY
jgi:hypothetical protein